MTTRKYQTQAIRSVMRLLKVGKRVCLVMPTGSGKTHVAGSIIADELPATSRVLFLAHRRELIEQCSRKLDALGVDHGVIMGSHPRHFPSRRVQVASVATMVGRLDECGTFDVIFIDEAHHARADSYKKIIDAFPTAKVIGLTATPWRLDGRGLGELFDALVVGSSVADLTDRKFLVPIKGFTYEVPDLRGVKKRGGDYNQKQAGKAMRRIVLSGNIVKQYQKHAAGKRAVVFAITKKHSKALVRKFKRAGIAAEHIDDSTPLRQRDAVLARLASGKTMVISNVGILGEGWDCPMAEVGILARPTASLVVALQQMGRLLRPWCFDCSAAPGPGCAAHRVKGPARIHDHAAVVPMHGQPAESREMSLDGDKPEVERHAKRCLACDFVNDASAVVCAECGADWSKDPKRLVVEYVAGKELDLYAVAKLKCIVCGGPRRSCNKAACSIKCRSIMLVPDKTCTICKTRFSPRRRSQKTCTKPECVFAQIASKAKPANIGNPDTVRDLSTKYGLNINTVKGRYRQGLRGDALVAQPHSGRRA